MPAPLEKYPESKVVVHVEEKPFVCDGRQLKSCSGDTWTFTLLKVPMDYLHEAKVRAPSDRTVTLRDGDHWEFGYVLEFVETPGHTPGTCELLGLSFSSHFRHCRYFRSQ